MVNATDDRCNSREADHVRGVSTRWSFGKLVRVLVASASAAIVCSPLLLAPRPKTPLRVFCITAFEFLARLQGCTLGMRGRVAMAHACDFGSLRDDYYDHGRFDASEYRLLRRELRQMAPEAATARYILQLRQAERSRPVLSLNNPRIVPASIMYRTLVLDLSLQWMQEISGLRVETAKFDVLLSLVGLMQIADDVLDWKEDQAACCPSYVTALLMAHPRSTVAPPLRLEADALLRRVLAAAKQDTGVIPFAIAGVVTWAFVAALLKLRFPQ